MLRIVSLIAGASLLLSACGTSTEDRAISGGGIGAAGGAVIGAVTGLTVVEGALIGALGGALTGALTDSDTVNLGTPAWRKDTAAANSRDDAAWDGGTASTEGRSVANKGAKPSPLVRKIQSGLAERGYNPGPADGIMGPRTADAIRDYQKDRGLLTDGRASLELAEHLELASN